MYDPRSVRQAAVMATAIALPHDAPSLYTCEYLPGGGVAAVTPSRYKVSRDVAKANGWNSGRSSLGVTQAATSGSSRQLAYCLAVS